jgi:hypothetical protein
VKQGVEQVWNSSDGNQLAQVIWARDGAQVICNERPGARSSHVWELRFNDEHWASGSVDSAAI